MRNVESVQETNKYSLKRLQGLKSYLYKRCQKLPKSSLLRPFSCGSTGAQKFRQTDRCHAGCPYDWESSTDEKILENVATPEHQYTGGEGEGEEGVLPGSFMKFHRPSLEEKVKENKVAEVGSLSFLPGKAEDKNSGAEDLMEEKVRELELMDLGDLEDVLDMEEALHYYSRLRSPVYLGIVNNFLIDMYSDFLVPEASSAPKRGLGQPAYCRSTNINSYVLASFLMFGMFFCSSVADQYRVDLDVALLRQS